MTLIVFYARVYVNLYLQFEHISIGSDVSFPCKKKAKELLLIIIQMCVSKYHRPLQAQCVGPKSYKSCVFFAEHHFFAPPKMNLFFLLTRTQFFITILRVCFLPFVVDFFGC